MPKTWWNRLPGVGARPLFLPDLERNASVFQEASRGSTLPADHTA